MRINPLYVRLLFGAFLILPLAGSAQRDYNYTRIEVVESRYQDSDPGANWKLNGEYLLHLPDDYSADAEPYPVLFFLHGAGARGSDLTKVSNLPPMLQSENGNRNFSFIVAAPQCLSGTSWHADGAPAEVMTFFEEVVESYNIDRDRIYLTGQSMGGRGTWVQLDSYPDYFAAAVPICGRNDPDTAPGLTDIPIWAFHGRLDSVIVPSYSIDMINAIVAAGGSQARVTIYEDIAHEVWWTVFKRPDIYDWMLSHDRGREPQPAWAEYAVDEAGYVDTGGWMGFLQVSGDPWIWDVDSGKWQYFPESHLISSSGQWLYVPRI